MHISRNHVLAGTGPEKAENSLGLRRVCWRKKEDDLWGGWWYFRVPSKRGIMKGSVVRVEQRTVKRVGTQDFRITEKNGLCEGMGVIGPSEWVRSVSGGQVHSTARICQPDGSNMQTRLCCSQVWSNSPSPHSLNSQDLKAMGFLACISNCPSCLQLAAPDCGVTSA